MAKGQVFQWIGLGVLGVAAIVGGVTYYYWHQFTSVPTWYTSSSGSQAINLSTLELPSDHEGQAATVIDQKVRDHLQSTDPEASSSVSLESSVPYNLTQSVTSSKPELVAIQLNEAELNQLIASELLQQSSKQPLLLAVKGINTSLEKDQVKAGAVINLARVPRQQLSDREQAAIDQLSSSIPGLKNRDLYVGFEGTPEVDNGQIKLTRSMRINLGNLSFTLGEFSQRSGISLVQLEQQLNALLQTQSLKIQDVQVQPNRLVIEGLANQ